MSDPVGSDDRKRQAEAIVRRLREAGREAYFAGGCVRDMAMGREPEDFDVATDARPEEVLSLFPGATAVGAAFGVVLVPSGEHAVEVATFRADGPSADGRRPVSVRFCSAREDVLRRDFTINGMLYDPVEDRVIDWVGGREDVARRLVRAIGDPDRRFEEDRLRLLRAVRFAARLGFAIEERTYEAICRHAPRVADLAAERVRDELVAILTAPDGRGGRGLRLLRDTGLLKAILPEVDRLVGVDQPPRFHPEGDVFEHTALMLDLARGPSPELAMGIVLHDVGKPLTQTLDDRIRFNEHDRVGAELARAVCARLRFSNEQTEHIVRLVAEHMRLPRAHEMRPSRLKRLLATERFEEHLELHRLDCLASHGKLDAHEFLRRALVDIPQEEREPPPLITGDDLIAMGMRPGPLFGTVLAAVRERQLDGDLRSAEEALAYVRKTWPAGA